MFYFIKGELALIDPAFAVIDANGVGYKLTISGTTYSALPHPTGSECPNVKLYSHLSVREDGVELFGFASLEELNIFRLLISVSGVGPKAAMALLTQLTPERLALAVCNDDKKQLSKAPGVGPKTAARIILELKDKLKAGNMVADTDSTASESAAQQSHISSDGKISEAVDALTVLGFNRAAAIDAVNKTDPENTELEDIIRQALKLLMK